MRIPHVWRNGNKRARLYCGGKRVRGGQRAQRRMWRTVRPTERLIATGGWGEAGAKIRIFLVSRLKEGDAYERFV